AALPPEPTVERSAVVAVVTPPAYSVGPGAFAPSAPLPAPPTPPPPGFALPPLAPPPAAYPGYPPQPAPFAPAPSGSSSKLMWVIVAVLVCGAGGAGVYVATRGKDAQQVAAADDAGTSHERQPDEPDKPDPWKQAPAPDAAVHTPDPPDDPDDKPDESDKGDEPDGAAASVPGKVLDVGQGVKLIAPPGYPVKRDGANVVVGDPMKLAILAGPIVEKTSDTDALARTYAKAAGLQILSSETRHVAGAMRKLYMIGGMVQGVPLVHIAVPIIGRNYRVAVIIHMLATAAQTDPSMLTTAYDVLAHRIVVPGAKPPP
ncbi:MAG TPA: hypothetical protein VN253_11265, partial [Kofleriaceae bacterium]|nr:hypothetical protein [Kofleriaceae bacterium]